MSPAAIRSLSTLPLPEGQSRGTLFKDYLAWRTEHGFSGTFEAMLTRPFVIHYYDVAYFGEGIAAGNAALDYRPPR